MRYKASDQRLVDRFVRELVKKVAARFPGRIDFAILYGSAARGEFVRGVSDIDLIFQAKDGKDVAAIKQYAAKVFWQLNRKLKTGFEKSCAIRKPKTLAGSIFNKLESQASLYTPLFVFGPGDLDWENGKVTNAALSIGANVIASQASIFHKFKTEGKIYYGRDIRKAIKPHFTLWEKLKGILIPQYLTAFSALIVWLFPKRAVKYCNKAILYAIDSAIIYLNDMRQHRVEDKIRLLQKATVLSIDEKRKFEIINFGLKASMQMVPAREFKIAEEALEYKIKGFSYGRIRALSYAYRCLWFVLRVNLSVIAKGMLRSIKRNKVYN
ncbi:MAG: nucleotidyltransferase domain-containing protein [Candidatus Woesearchaeota archaeon]